MIDAARAADDLRHARDVIARSRALVDGHSLHAVMWGAILLVHFPVTQALFASDRLALGLVWVGVSIGGGWAGALLIERRLARRAPLSPGDAPLRRRILAVIGLTMLAASTLSGVLPSLGMDPRRVPIIWGFASALLTTGIGLVYHRAYVTAGLAMLAGAGAAAALPGVAGYVLGPSIGLPLLLAGAVCLRRERALHEQAAE